MGALSRYAVQGWVNDLIGRPTILGTMAVNLSGAFVLGLFLTLTEDRFLVTGPWRTMVAVGFLGAYTTFSTLMYETVDRMETGDFATAAANILFSVAIGLLAVYAGIVAGRTI
jgi:CrcB protein